MTTPCKKSVLMLLDNHFTHDTRALKEATTFVNAGYSVTLKCYGDSNLPRSENINGIHIDRIINLSRTQKKSLIHKIYLLLSFIGNVLKSSRDFNYIHCHDLMMLPIGVLAKWWCFGKARLVYDSHEYQTERNGQANWKKPILRVFESFFIKQSNASIVVSNSIADEYARLYNIKKPYVVLNAPPYRDTPVKPDIFRETFNIKKDQIIYLYQGGFNRGRSIEKILDIFSDLNDSQKVIIFMGHGALEERVKHDADRFENIFYHPTVSPDILLDYTSSADIGLCLIENTCLSYYYCLPNKLFEYMMADLPTIVSDLYELEKIAKKHDTGWILPQENINTLREIVKTTTAEDIKLKKENLKKIKPLYSWEEQEKILLSIYNQLETDNAL